MDLQTRKIQFVQEFLDLKSEEIIRRFENMLRREKMKKSHTELEPMALKQFNKRIDSSIEDSNSDRVIESEKLLSDIEKWD